MAKIKVTDEQLLEAIKATGGKWTGICEMLNISRPTLARYAKRPLIAEALEFAHVRIVDRAEYKLMEAVERGEAWAIQLVLKDSKRGKERGYGNSVEVEHKGNLEIGIKQVDYRNGVSIPETGSSDDSGTSRQD